MQEFESGEQSKLAIIDHDERLQKERYEKVLSEINDFSERFTDSKHLEEVSKVKTETNNILKNLKNEQVKKTNER